jgi:hypothetical protein
MKKYSTSPGGKAVYQMRTSFIFLNNFRIMEIEKCTCCWEESEVGAFGKI